MENADPNPVFIGLFFIIRCLVPLIILFGISYLLRRLGLVADQPAGEDEKTGTNEAEGDAAHEH